MIKIKLNHNKFSPNDCMYKEENKEDFEYKIDCKIDEELLNTKKVYSKYFQKNGFQRFHRIYDYFIYEKKNIEKEFKTPHVTNAWIKFQELVTDFQLIPDSADKFIYFDNAAFPGAFIYAINHYVSTKTDIKDFLWYGSSLLGGEDIALQDRYKLYKRFPEKWLMDDKNKGDVTDINNIEYWEKYFHNTVDLYTSDLGMDVSHDYAKQEEIQLPPNIGQILAGLVVLKNGGSMVTKQYTIFLSQNLSILALLTNLFEEVYVAKPITSRPFNSETYIVCKKFLGPFKKDTPGFLIINEIKNKIANYNKLAFIKKKCFDKNFLSSIKDVFNKIFYRQIDIIYEEMKLFDKLEKTKTFKERKKIYELIEKKRRSVVDIWNKTIKLKKLEKRKI
ncbi:FtsJ-like methyltransferase [seawater metagenome]|uniref:FtsJ-like methyltransferase n=1 Tax=seawater metagenome TaxID=1561972 RepID=A0A5E8CIX0_9ZZZZ